MGIAAAGVIGTFSLVGCGANEYVGTWVPDEITESGITINAEGAESQLGMKLEDFMTIEFKEDDKVTVSTAMDEDGTKDGTYEVDGDNIKVTIEGDSINFKKEGDNLVLDGMPGDDSSDLKVKFKKK